MAIDYQTQFDAIQNIQQYFPTTNSWAQYSAVLRPLIVEAQTQAIAADPVAQAFLLANRRFVINSGLVSVTLNYNGVPYVFAPASSYCMHADEAAHFLAQAVQGGFTNIVNDPLAFGYFGGSGVVRFFFF